MYKSLAVAVSPGETRQQSFMNLGRGGSDLGALLRRDSAAGSFLRSLRSLLRPSCDSSWEWSTEGGAPRWLLEDCSWGTSSAAISSEVFLVDSKVDSHFVRCSADVLPPKPPSQPLSRVRRRYLRTLSRAGTGAGPLSLGLPASSDGPRHQRANRQPTLDTPGESQPPSCWTAGP